MNTSSDTKGHLPSKKKKRSKRNIQRTKKRAKWAKRSIDVAAVSSRRLQEENENTFLKKIDEISIIDPANEDHNWSFNPHSPSFDSSAQLLRAGSLQVPSQHNEEGFASHSASAQPRIENGLANGWSSGYYALVQPRIENGLANDWPIDPYASVQPRHENGLANGWSSGYYASVQPRIENGLAYDRSINHDASVQP